MTVLSYLFNSAMAGPLEDPEGTEYRCQRDASSAEEVLLLRPERGRAGPGAAEPSLRAGESPRVSLLFIRRGAQLAGLAPTAPERRRAAAPPLRRSVRLH